MRINKYYVAESLDDAYNHLQHSKHNTIIGGGAWMKLTPKEYEEVIDIGNLHLNEIEETKFAFRIGANVTLREIENHLGLKNYLNGILSSSAGQIMGVGIRNLATIGGSIMGKFSFSDLLTPLLAMHTQLQFYKAGTKTLQEYINEKHMEPDILTHIIIKKEHGKGYFYKAKKTALDFAIINVCVTNINGVFRIVCGARSGIATNATKAMEYINQQKEMTDQVLEETARIASEELHLSSNVRASKEYRKELFHVYVRRGLKEVC